MYLIPAEDVMEFTGKGYVYDLSELACVNNLSEDARIQSTYDGKIFSLPLSYTCFGFLWNVDLLEQYDLEVPENLEDFWQVCETLKQNGILPYGANRDVALIAPVMCAGFAEVYRSENVEELLKGLSDGSVPVSRYAKKGFAFLQTMLDKGYMDREQALQMLPDTPEEKQFFTEGKCAFSCVSMGKAAFEGYSFETAMTALPVLPDGSACILAADQRLAINPNSGHLEDAVNILEMLGTKASLDAFAADQGKISSASGAQTPAIPQAAPLVAAVESRQQIPSQDFRLCFNVWDPVRNLSVRLLEGESVDEVSAAYDALQKEEIAKYKTRL